MKLTFTGRALIVLGVVTTLVFAPTPQSAYACSGEPPDPREAAAIAEGWVERAVLRPDLPALADFTPVEVTLRVERLLHGSAPNPLIFVDPRSAVLLPDGRLVWAGGSGACGILDADPTGRYALVVFGRSSDGAWTVHRIAGAAFGDSPDASQIQRFRQLLIARLLPTMPKSGVGGSQLGTAPMWELGLALLALALLARRYVTRGRRHSPQSEGR